MTHNLTNFNTQLVFSVIIPTFNRADLVSHAVHSVLAQTFTDFELIIVDDGSTDQTRAVIESINDPRLRYVRQENKGRSAARNVGVAVSRGQYVTFLDSDDEVLPEWLEQFSRGFEEAGVGMVRCESKTITGAHREKQKAQSASTDPENVVKNQSDAFLTGTFALRRDVFEAIGGYAAELSYAENTELAFRLFPYCQERGLKIVVNPQPLLIYHERPFDSSKIQVNSHTILEATKYILSRHADGFFQKYPGEYANNCSIAGVNAARLEQYAEARRFFMRAVRAKPGIWKYYTRLLLTLIPPLGRRFWLRHNYR